MTIDDADGFTVITPSDDGEGSLPDIWHVVTAHNPGSVQLSDDENRQRHDELLATLKSSGYSTAAASGQGLDGNWPPETSVAIRDIDTATAIEFGRRFGQLAIFRLGHDHIEVLDCESGEVRSARRFTISRGPR